MSIEGIDGRIAAVAERQHGHVSRAQALALGMTTRMIGQRTSSGRWEPVTGRVFRLCGAPRTWQGRLLAAVLDAGDGAVATGRSGAALWRVAGYAMREPEALILRPSDHRPPLGRLHETRYLPQHHRTVQQGVPVVTPARLMVELAAIERPQRVERAVDDAIAASILTPEALAGAVAELCHRGRKGAAALKALTLEIVPGYVPPASELEARFRDLVRTAGIPDEMVRQADVGGEDWIGRVDVWFPAARLVVELDSRRWHSSRMAVAADGRRVERLERAGCQVLSLSWRRLVDDPIGVVHDLRTRLGERRAA